jgi:hypothetical protein
VSESERESEREKEKEREREIEEKEREMNFALILWMTTNENLSSSRFGKNTPRSKFIECDRTQRLTWEPYIHHHQCCSFGTVDDWILIFTK